MGKCVPTTTMSWGSPKKTGGKVLPKKKGLRHGIRNRDGPPRRSEPITRRSTSKSPAECGRALPLPCRTETCQPRARQASAAKPSCDRTQKPPGTLVFSWAALPREAALEEGEQRRPVSGLVPSLGRRRLWPGHHELQVRCSSNPGILGGDLQRLEKTTAGSRLERRESTAGDLHGRTLLALWIGQRKSPKLLRKNLQNGPHPPAAQAPIQNIKTEVTVGVLLDHTWMLAKDVRSKLNAPGLILLP